MWPQERIPGYRGFTFSVFGLTKSPVAGQEEAGLRILVLRPFMDQDEATGRARDAGGPLKSPAAELREGCRRAGGFTYNDLLATCALQVFTRWNRLHCNGRSQK